MLIGYSNSENQQMATDDGTGVNGGIGSPGSLCNLDLSNNVWVEGRDDENPERQPGVCMLDTMAENQIVDIVSRDERARADLLKVTSDRRMIEIANQVKRLPTEEPGDSMQRVLGGTKDAGAFYTQFRGRVPWVMPK